jgi:hypothetical protein
MTRKIVDFVGSNLRTLAALAVLLGAGLIAAAPAHADHDRGPDVGFHFFFGFPPPPPPPVVVYGPPPVYYYDPAPRIVIQDRPYYRDWNYRERHYRADNWRGHHHNRNHRDYDDD